MSYIITLDKKGALKSSNHNLVSLFGASEETMNTMPYTSWITGDDNQGLRDSIEMVYKKEEPVTRSSETISVSSRGGTMTISYNIMPLKVEKGAEGKKRYSRRKSSLLVGPSDSEEFKSKALNGSGLSAVLDGLEQRPYSPSESAISSSNTGDVVFSTPDSPSREMRSTPLGKVKRDSKNSVGTDNSDDDRNLQGVVIVLENLTEERLRQSAIQRYQRRLNEMENKVQEFSDLKNKLQTLDLDSLNTDDITPETTRGKRRLA